jgi:hypothetical protein
MITVKTIIEDYLRAHGFDGLCNDDCGCPLGALMPCDGYDIATCTPGYAAKEADGLNIIQAEKPVTP